MAAEIAQMPEAPTAANIDVVSLQISLPQMLDLALGAPEVGAVNFNILHNFLHILLHQINLQATKVEYRGENADRIKRMVTSLKPSPVLRLHEYSITDATGEVLQRIRRDNGADADVLTDDLEKIPEAQMVVSVVNGPPTALAFKELEQSVKQLQQRYQALEDLSTSPEIIEGLKDRITDPTADIWQFININKRLDANEQGIDKLTAMVQDVIKGDISIADTSLINARLTELEDKVSKMEQWLINLQTIADVLTEGITVPTTDVTVKEKEERDEIEEIAAAETVVTNDVIVPHREKEEKANEISKIVADKIRKAIPDKLVSRVTLPNDTALAEIRQDVTVLKTDVARIQQDLQDLNKRVAQNEMKLTTIVEVPLVQERPIVGEPIEDKEKIVEVPLVQERPIVGEPIEDKEKIVKVPLVQERPIVGEPIEDKEKIVEVPLVQERPIVGEPIEDKEKIVEVPLIQERPIVGELIEDKEKIVKVSDVANLKHCLEVIKNVETTHGKALNDVTQRMVEFETEIGHLLEKVDSIEEANKIGDVSINKLVAKVQGIETDMEKIEQAMDRFLDDKEKQKMDINTLLEQIEFLKTVKANKEELEDALADKADAQAVNRKVSRDQFDAACDDLARGLEEAIDKLTKQESIWQQALDEVQNEIATKLDKNEMMPLKDFVNNKLKSLQEKLKIMIEARREIEAAGTKKLLRDVQCISCDKDVVMKTEEIGRFRAEPLPCTISLKPYLTYELDKVRKQQKRLPYSRNMIQFEAAIQEEAKKMKAKEEMLAKTPRDHLCNRYCGGSHTITTPQQRVMRTGHFLTQWGPEAIQLTDGLIRGKNGQMYRSRLMPGKDVCGPSCWESQINEELSECASTTSRKFLPSQRNSAGNQKRNLRKQSRETKVSELEEKSTETHHVTSPQENDDSPFSAGLQDGITLLYKTNEEKKIE